MTQSDSPRIIDYEGSTYRTDFWEGRGRDYEDRVERQVIRRLLPTQGRRLLELGAGFGRLTNEYSGYQQVVLLDYSFSQLQYARQQFGDDGYVYVAANVYKLPFQPGIFDAATMIRVIHHMADVPAVLNGIRQKMSPGATFVLEFANKRNLKAMFRYALRRQDWSPYDRAPVEFVELNFDFHPAYMGDELAKAGFTTEARVPVSFFRLGLLKRTLPAGLLTGMDGILQRTGLTIAPSIFTKNIVVGDGVDNLSMGDTNNDDLFLCPETGSALHREGDMLVSEDGLRWAVREGIYDFKAPVE